MTTRAEWHLPTNLIGRRVLHFSCVDSTNTVAAHYSADPANDGLVILADEQTAGRGRQGRTWQSQPETSVLLSVLLFPDERLLRPVILTTMAASAVCETVYHVSQMQATIKWPNDVLVRGRKICGILVERGQALVIGIGLNVNTPAEAFAATGLDQAGSLAILGGRTFDCRNIAETLLHQLDVHYTELLNGNTADLEASWRWHSGLLGKNVMVTSGKEELAGRLVEMSFSSLVLSTPNGRMHHLTPETIETLKEKGRPPYNVPHAGNES